eukprot:gene9742-12362_t
MGALDRASVLAALAETDPVVRTAAIRLSERFFQDAVARTELTARLLPLADDAAPEVQLQAVLTLGELRDPATDLVLAETVRAHPTNTYLRDAFYSGLAERESPVLEALAARPAWSADDAKANAILSGLANGTFASRQTARIERLIALAAAQPPGSGRPAALLDGMIAGTNGSRRPLSFVQKPAGWFELEKNPALTARLAKLNDIVVWPGKTGLTAVAAIVPLTA